MTGLNSVFHPKDAVVSILSAFKEKGRAHVAEPEFVKNPPTGATTTSTLITKLPCGFELHRLTDGQTGVSGERISWKPDATFFANVSRTRGEQLAVFSLRGNDGSCHTVFMAEGSPLTLSSIAQAGGSPATIPDAALVGRSLSSLGVDIGRFAHRLAALVDRAGRMHFIDDCPDKLDLTEDFSGHSDIPVVLPKVLVSDGDFFLMDSGISRNFLSVNVRGTLGLVGMTGLVVPSHLNVGKDLIFQMSDIDRLPSRFSVGRDLNLTMTKVTEFPEHFHVGRNIRANGSSLSRLHGGFTVKGDLDLRDCPIAELPWGLEVAGSLNVTGTEIARIPSDTAIGGNLLVEEGVVLPSTIRLGGYLMYARPYGYETVAKPSN